MHVTSVLPFLDGSQEFQATKSVQTFQSFGLRKNKASFYIILFLVIYVIKKWFGVVNWRAPSSYMDVRGSGVARVDQLPGHQVGKEEIQDGGAWS